MYGFTLWRLRGEKGLDSVTISIMVMQDDRTCDDYIEFLSLLLHNVVRHHLPDHRLQALLQSRPVPASGDAAGGLPRLTQKASLTKSKHWLRLRANRSVAYSTDGAGYGPDFVAACRTAVDSPHETLQKVISKT